MKILTVGGGPGGLYASLLLKKRNPDHDITVIERNPAGATYGWGVVFSSLTLTSFREADYKTYQRISDSFVIWDPIDIHYRGQLIRCGGHTFAGLSRRGLLNILTERCLELGVKIEFQREFTDFTSLQDYDVVIASDGVNSFIRKAYADVFKPSLRVGRAKYIWFGTDRVFDSFTFVIRDNEHGLFQVHAYPFDGRTSTFIVECDEASWLNAGLDKAGESASIAYCETLFADILHGHRLMSNKSAWGSFVEVKNKSWSHDNLVLLGDSAHTAHFSIGSGTRLAMEDAIALANAFDVHGDDVKAVFKLYELERKPRVEALQAAAKESQTYFETLKRYAHLEPMQFTFHLLSRSGRLNYDNLRLRDPFYVDRVDRWFANAVGCGDGDLVLVPAPVFMLLRVGSCALLNRVVFSVSSVCSAGAVVLFDDYAKDFLQKAKSGAALILTEPIAVSPNGRITPDDLGLYTDQHLAAWTQLIADLHKNSSAKVALQLSHAGRRGSTRPRQHGLDKPLRAGNWSLLSASDIPYTSRSQTPKTMDRADMDEICTEFANAAKLAHTAGVDILLLNMAHGYLLASFLSPLTNTRTDEYGGSLDNRLRYPLQVLDAVRAEWSDRPLAVAFNASDWVDGGTDIDEAVEVAKVLKTHRVDLLFPLAGQTIPDDHPSYDPNFLAKYSERIRNEVRVLVMTTGNITTSNQVNTLLAAGSADLCILHPPLVRE